MATTVNGPSAMYKLSSYYNETEHIEIPKCMYKLPNYYADEQVCSTSSEVDQLEARQEAILRRLEALSREVDALTNKSNQSPTQAHNATNASASVTANKHVVEKLSGVVRDVVISASPERPPLSLVVLGSLLAAQHPTLITNHVHSSAPNVPDKLKATFTSAGDKLARHAYSLAVTVVWKQVSHEPYMMVSPSRQSTIEGEACIARYLARHLSPSYEADIHTACQVDSWLDQAATFSAGGKKERAGVLKSMNTALGQAAWLVGGEMSLADIVLWSVLHQSGDVASVPGNVKKWLLNCNNHAAFQNACNAV